MFASIRKKLNELRCDTSGNATMLMALGLPVLIGGSGLAVDTAQWYMWKNELQFAVDQAALAGAWARTSADTAVQATYKTRAAQEYAVNLSMVGDFDSFNSAEDVTLAKYDGSSVDNSVVVHASASKPLPFSNFFTGGQATVTVRAQAKYTSGVEFNACMLAIHPTADSAFKFGGSVGGSSTCGAGSLSNDPNAAMKEVGNTSVPLGKLIATGGIDPGFANNGTIYEDQTGLLDPYASLDTPSSSGSTAREYNCTPASSAATQADVTVRTEIEYAYYTKSGNTYTLNANYNGIYKKPKSDDKPGVTTQDQVVTSTLAYSDQPYFSDYEKFGSGQSTIYQKSKTTKSYSYSDIRTIPANDGIARPQPGIYTNISVACPTIFQAGIYFISGSIDFGQNLPVTAAGSLFVMTGNSGSIKINSNSNLDLKGITSTTLTTTYGYDSAQAAKMAGMLFWDKNSTSSFDMEGNATVKIDGTMYMPNRDATFNGNVNAATGGCMMVASRTLTINGNFNITNFCTPSGATSMALGGGTASVKLVG